MGKQKIEYQALNITQAQAAIDAGKKVYIFGTDRHVEWINVNNNTCFASSGVHGCTYLNEEVEFVLKNTAQAGPTKAEFMQQLLAFYNILKEQFKSTNYSIELGNKVDKHGEYGSSKAIYITLPAITFAALEYIENTRAEHCPLLSSPELSPAQAGGTITIEMYAHISAMHGEACAIDGDESAVLYVNVKHFMYSNEEAIEHMVQNDDAWGIRELLHKAFPSANILNLQWHFDNIYASDFCPSSTELIKPIVGKVIEQHTGLFKAALQLFNEYIESFGGKPLSEEEAVCEWELTGNETPEKLKQYARDEADEQRITKAQNKDAHKYQF